MFKATVKDSFSAAHRLVGYQGDCERLHGHNYRVELSVVSDRLDSTGIIMDFRELKHLLKDILDEMDHRYLNELEAFEGVSPSAEVIARHIYRRVLPSIEAPVVLSEVVVWENDTSRITYTE